MYLLSTFIALASVHQSHSATLSNAPRAVQISYDQVYSNSSSTLSTVACASSPNNPNKSGHNATFNSKVYIAASDLIPKFDSPFCFTCWDLFYTLQDGEQNAITVAAVDSTDSGFVVSPEALDALTHGQAERLGVAKGQASQVDRSRCRL
ncbi:hypothetical protein BDN72DRAFT_609042 [Pluteus cervinus]|uniref:Uncharacterized protein n=1 Tax=Pluteus cervinus TaxID=181527 RepID=A0ACD3A2G0_9AGAR|nr:hypothetical protein BDN72DRAFT_609042 [Pluteus cervinus]